MTQTAAETRLIQTADPRATGSVVQRGLTALVTALRRSDDRRRLASTLVGRDVGRETGARC